MTLKAVLILLLAVLLVLLGYWVRGLQCTAGTDKAIIKQVAQNQQTEKHDDGTIAIEEKALDDATLQPVAAPVVRLCYTAPPRAVLPARPPGAEPHAPASNASRAAVPVDPGPDIGPALVSVGRYADAQVIELQDYITKVCRPRP